MNTTELLIANGQLVADTLRHLADNEIDSDYFAITSTSENGTEIEHELVITDYALQAASTVEALVEALESAQRKIENLEGEIEVVRDVLSDTEDAMHLWAERAKKAEAKYSVPVAYVPKGHIRRYLSGENSGCWVYGNPTNEDDDALYIVQPNANYIDYKAICEKVHSKCSRIAGATFYNAAEFALDEVKRAGIKCEVKGE